MAAGGVPVCLCGGSAEMVEPAEQVLPSNHCPLIKSTFGYSLEKANPFLEMADLVVAESSLVTLMPAKLKKAMETMVPQKASANSGLLASWYTPSYASSSTILTTTAQGQWCEAGAG